MLPPTVAERIEKLIVAASASGSAFRPVIAVAGPVASGKTTLGEHLAGLYGAQAFSTDEYLPDYATIPRIERDEPRHADLSRLATDLASLRTGRSTQIPAWSFFDHRRTDERLVHPGRAVVFEGLFALHPTVRDTVDFALLVDAPEAVRFQRFVRRSSVGERGFSRQEAAAHFHEVAEPTYWRHEPAYRAVADARLSQDGAGGFEIVSDD